MLPFLAIFLLCSNLMKLAVIFQGLEHRNNFSNNRLWWPFCFFKMKAKVCTDIFSDFQTVFRFYVIIIIIFFNVSALAVVHCEI